MTPPDATVSRRALLAATSGFLLAAACGGGKKKDQNAGSSSTTSTSSGVARLNVLPAGFVPLAGVDQRMAFGILLDLKPIAADIPVTIAFGEVDQPPGEPQPAVRLADGIENRPLHVVHHRFDKPGVWQATVKAAGQTAVSALQILDPAASAVPSPGQPMPKLATPTTADARGLNPICTRQPACPWHDVSLDAALGAGKPLVLLVSTPALCQSQVCGPVLESLLALREPYEAKGVKFLHAEVFTDLTGKTPAPIMGGLHLENEPIAFFVEPDGKVAERFDGPFARSEAKAALDRLTA